MSTQDQNLLITHISICKFLSKSEEKDVVFGPVTCAAVQDVHCGLTDGVTLHIGRRQRLSPERSLTRSHSDGKVIRVLVLT